MLISYILICSIFALSTPAGIKKRGTSSTLSEFKKILLEYPIVLSSISILVLLTLGFFICRYGRNTEASTLMKSKGLSEFKPLKDKVNF